MKTVGWSIAYGVRLCVTAVAITTLAFATGCNCESVYTVGSGDTMWGVPPYGSFFQDWADEVQLIVNDSLYFSYDSSSHNVVVVETTDELKDCVITFSPLAVENSGSTILTFIFPGTYYLLSHVDGLDCQSGMRFAINVWPSDPGPDNYNSPDPGSSFTSAVEAPSTAPITSLSSNSEVGGVAKATRKATVDKRLVTNIPWQPHSDPNWASSILVKPVQVDSYLVFQYSKSDNYSVYRVDYANYKQCNSSNALETVEFGVSVSLPQPGDYYYIDGNQTLCQNSNMKLRVQVPGRKSGSHVNVKVVVPVVIVILLALTIFGFIIYLYRKRTAHRRYKDRYLVYSRSYERSYERSYATKSEITTAASRNKKLIDDLLREKNGNQPCTFLFTKKELEEGTSNFSRDNELGSGAFGTVYKGILRDGRMVAVKRANAQTATDVEQFVNEVSILSQVNHRNLVKLLGCCLDLKVPLLVYEFIPNGTLQEHLGLAHEGYSTKLDWPHRFNIAMQTAEALKYLHWEATPPIVHRDVKAANILLDDDFGAKVADFGLSKLLDVGATHVSTAVRGTPGYLDPEYYFNSQLTDKSDVYSYGIVLLELISSKKPIDLSLDPAKQNLALRLVPVIKSNRARDIIDPRLIRGFVKKDFETVEAVAEVAVACLVPERASRPTMSEVVEMLQMIRGSNLQPESFFNKDDISNKSPSIQESLPFSNLSRIFRSVYWREHSSLHLERMSQGLPRSNSYVDLPVTSQQSGGSYFDKDSIAPR